MRSVGLATRDAGWVLGFEGLSALGVSRGKTEAQFIVLKGMCPRSPYRVNTLSTFGGSGSPPCNRLLRTRQGGPRLRSACWALAAQST